jgi:anti-anti-sigma factor
MQSGKITSFTVTMPKPGVRVVRFASSNIMASLDDEGARQSLDEVVQGMNENETLIFNLEKVAYLSSVVLAMFVTVQRRMMERKGRFVICGLKQEVTELFRVTHLEQLFRLATNEEQAISEAEAPRAECT